MNKAILRCIAVLESYVECAREDLDKFVDGFDTPDFYKHFLYAMEWAARVTLHNLLAQMAVELLSSLRECRDPVMALEVVSHYNQDLRRRVLGNMIIQHSTSAFANQISLLRHEAACKFIEVLDGLEQSLRREIEQEGTNVS